MYEWNCQEQNGNLKFNPCKEKDAAKDMAIITANDSPFVNSASLFNQLLWFDDFHMCA